MKNFKHLCFSLTALAILFSCNKENVSTLPEIEVGTFDYSTAPIKQYINGEYVASEILEKPDNYFAVQNNTVDDQGNPLIESLFFSQKEDYLNWGDNNNVNFRGSLEFQAGIHAYLDKNPELLEIEDLDLLPKSYKEFENNLYKEIFGLKVQNRGTSILGKECVGGAHAPLLLTLPLMWPGWNNEASENYGVYIFASYNIFNKSFYRAHMVSYVWFGGTDCWENRFYDDKMSSVILL